MKRLLILEDGSVYEGEGFGSSRYQMGELVFNTGMSGYQEVLSDLSYCGQIVMMTYPMIGNYGINCDDFESLDPAVFGFVVRECCAAPSNFRSDYTLDEFLKQKDIPGISGVDTRAITRKLRNSGTMRAIMADEGADVEAIVAMLRSSELMHDQVARVSTKNAFPIPNRGKRVVLIDFGAKNGIIRELSRRNCDLTVVPYDTSAKEILAMKPDGVMLSNGPGDPKDVPVAIETIRELMGQVVIFGICLGHQLISLASGANTVKLKFGHRGCNHPVMNLANGKVEMTSQNHGYAVEEASLKDTDLVMTHQALNDKSVEGVRHSKYPIFSVQYHPEASPGPEDSNYLFDQFMELMEKEAVKR
ncbi:MAG TPA: carbamoyl phosphate synthase small subunit [Candidatus Merdibacter merdigallinarum]|uniref:Carbamoyl phosphate synthase small chain n=1 Tax=Amedibacillus dolichus TaxID=31971 RepID=A0ABT7U9Z5_9FIRM|nr:carbamoyl phosphate synthase small subunit [Amedibacillus dolichus]MDM8156451.1 carbamoyl phosphate synthase small subunit [Amedibacillus dolichus]HJB05241.1 carbamoyl phosphate synthase small subunit [Candidatus Merdibacter merdigallinarum]